MTSAFCASAVTDAVRLCCSRATSWCWRVLEVVVPPRVIDEKRVPEATASDDASQRSRLLPYPHGFRHAVVLVDDDFLRHGAVGYLRVWR